MIRNLANINIFSFLIQIIAVVFSLSFHECAHAYWAKHLGDDTAEKQGRITLNPLAHLEPIGFLMMVFAPIGWAKPVMVNPSKFRPGKNSRTGFMEVALAGPVSNLILAWIAYFLYALIYKLSPNGLLDQNLATSLLLQLFLMLIAVNINLAVFNLLPIPPLDGFNIYGRFLPPNIYRFIYEKSNMCMMAIFFILVLSPSSFARVMNSLRMPFFYVISKSVDFILSIF